MSKQKSPPLRKRPAKKRPPPQKRMTAPSVGSSDGYGHCCEECGRWYAHRRSDSKTCGAACRQRRSRRQRRYAGTLGKGKEVSDGRK